MRRYGELSKDQEPSLPHQFCSDCIITTGGYDFRKGQRLIGSITSQISTLRSIIGRLDLIDEGEMSVAASSAAQAERNLQLLIERFHLVVRQRIPVKMSEDGSERIRATLRQRTSCDWVP
jgi:hypothetical protein